MIARSGYICAVIMFILWGGLGQAAHGQALSLDLEALRLPNIGAGWTTISTINNYTDPVVVCTYNLVSSANPSATVRLRNVSSASFDVRIQQFENSSVVTPGDVHCLVADTGAHTLPNGQKYEALTVLSDQTSGLSVGWQQSRSENITGTKIHSYANPVVLGSVMTFNDVNASVFWTWNGASRGAPPTNAAMWVGKHIGQINNTRASETLGVIIFETGAGTVNDVPYAFGRTPDFGAGVGNNPPYTASVSGNFETGVLTQAAEDGGQGGWAILYGTDPLPNNGIQLAAEEEVVAGDTTRRHTTENYFYAVFENNQTPNLSASKVVDTFDPLSTGLYNIPGTDVIYTIEFENTGSAPVDPDTIFLVDEIPDNLTFYNGDIDDGGPETDVVAVTENNSGLTLDLMNDLKFSNSATRPTNISQCNYGPAMGYDPAVTYICLAPSGRFNSGTLHTNSKFELSFRARID